MGSIRLLVLVLMAGGCRRDGRVETIVAVPEDAQRSPRPVSTAQVLPAEPMEGPFPDSAAYCSVAIRPCMKQGTTPCHCRPHYQHASSVRPPFDAVEIAEVTGTSNAKAYRIVLHTAEGWWVSTNGPGAGADTAAGTRYTTTFEMRTFEVRDVLPDGTPEVVLTYRSPTHAALSSAPTTALGAFWWRSDGIMICGSAGVSGRPRCADTSTAPYNDPGTAYEIQATPDGEIKVPTYGRESDAEAGLAGPIIYQLSFAP